MSTMTRHLHNDCGDSRALDVDDAGPSPGNGPPNVDRLPRIPDSDARSQRRSRHVRSVYERAAGRYGDYRRMWLAVAGKEAEQAMLRQIVAAASRLQNPRVLDAGAGTGGLSRLLTAQQPDVRPFLVDLSPAMLAQASDIDGLRTTVTLDALPFPDDTFDIIMCGWVIETVANPDVVITELLRVLSPNGLLTYSFCSKPLRRLDRWRTWPLRSLVHVAFAGHFLTSGETPFHQCAKSTRQGFRAGRVTVISLGKCCSVSSPTVVQRFARPEDPPRNDQHLHEK